jgi:hypothetical protein
METNSIGTELNRGGALLARNERSFEISKVKYLSQSMPVCVTYRMPLTPPWLSEGFKETIRNIAKGYKPTSKNAHYIANLHYGSVSSDSGAAFPAEITLNVMQVLRETFPEIVVRAIAIPKADFRRRASCGPKDTVFVDNDQFTFYTKDYPDERPVSGNVHFRDVLFVQLDERSVDAVAAQDATLVRSTVSNKDE